MDELIDLTVKEAVDALTDRQISSRELTEAFLNRISTHEAEIHAFITPTPEMALEIADSADTKRAHLRKNGETIPPLLGLPLVIKDVLCVDGVRATCGSKILEHFEPPFNATAVEKLLDAGIVVLGKTNTDEFAMGSSTENSAYGVTHNPWNMGRVPGGSSGGSAAAVAAKFAPAALGTDTGGSVRQPASFCGVTGIKPTYGRVSRYGLIAYGSSLDTVGVLARTAEDVETIFRLTAGFDDRDATTIDVPVADAACREGTDIKGLRIGVPKEYFIEGIQPAVEQSVRAAIEMFRRLGAEIIDISLPHTEYALPVYYIIAPAEASANLARYDGVRFGLRASDENMLDMFTKSRGAGFGSEVKRRIMLGTYALSAGYYDAYYGQAQKVRKLIRMDFESVFTKVDVIAAPVAPTTAFKIGGHGDDPLAMYLEDIFTLPANLAGVPGLAFPVGFDSDELPIGMQLMGKHFDEATLFKLAHVFQRHTKWHLKTPAL
ncbi:MAG: Asp-tRNA(Asn)/Glu-tRNA(Gln) amidotransferase subunit GatA [Anaerolineaceae bacterium]|nr:Asp-tRNA(Asn)/Glu-tRNA(Gln) amidotransferase subunit GatA [Anaerolineaceae bacterium]